MQLSNYFIIMYILNKPFTHGGCDTRLTFNPNDLCIHSIWTPPPQYFYLWGFLKDNMYENNPQSIAELKRTINRKIRAIPKKVWAIDRLCSTNSSVPSTHWWSFGIHPAKNASFELETSNQCFFVMISASRTCHRFLSFFISVKNHYHINE